MKENAAPERPSRNEMPIPSYLKSSSSAKAEGAAKQNLLLRLHGYSWRKHDNRKNQTIPRVPTLNRVLVGLQSSSDVEQPVLHTGYIRFAPLCLAYVVAE